MEDNKKKNLGARFTSHFTYPNFNQGRDTPFLASAFNKFNFDTSTRFPACF